MCISLAGSITQEYYHSQTLFKYNVWKLGVIQLISLITCSQDILFKLLKVVVLVE